MKTLHLYLTRQVVVSLLMTVAVFTFVFLLGNLLNEILWLLVKGQASLGIVLRALGLLVPFVLVFALPIALLTATLLVFGRFSADQELTAARAGGISLVSLTPPILLLSLGLCGISAYVNLQFGPSSRVAYKNLLFAFGAKFVGAYLPEGVYIKTFPGVILHIEKNDRGQLHNIMIAEQQGGTNVALMRAQRGNFSLNATNNQLIVNLYDVKGIRSEGGRDIVGKFSWLPLTLDYSRAVSAQKKPRISDFTFHQLRAELEELERSLRRPMLRDTLSEQEDREHEAQVQKQLNEFVSPLRVQLHRQVSFSFACFGFTLIGIPLGIRTHRRETSASFALALVLVLIYYSFIVAAESLATRPEFFPHLLVWVPNFLFQTVGAVLLWRANRGL